LERISDHAVSIAKRAKKIINCPELIEVNLVEPVYTLAESLLRDAVSSYSDGNAALGASLHVRDKELDKLHKDKGSLRGVPTGLADLDNKLAGLQKSDMIVLAARPAMGKTTLAMNIAHHVAAKEKQPVLVFSLEMSKEQLVDRLLSAESGIDSWNLRTGNLTDKDFHRLGSAMGELSEAPIYIDDTPGITILEMRTKARREQHKHQLGLIVIDYLQLMSGGKNTDGRVQEISEISRGVKALARELDVPVIALSQLSRSVEQRHPQIPQLSDLRESGSIEQDADIVMFIYREEYYNDETERKSIADIIISKHRNGPTGKIETYFKPENLQFKTIDRRHASEVPAEL
jgi:replicative DNA helicase